MIPSAELAPIRELYHRGLYLQAYELSRKLGPLVEWRGPGARLLAGRLAIQLGAPRLGAALHLRARKESPAHLEAIYYHARHLLEKFGPESALRFVREHDDWSDASPDLRADWAAAQALIYARVRDVDQAERWLAQAESIAPNRAWINVERSSVAEVTDRVEEALAHAQRALELQPWFRPAVQAVAHLFHRTNRLDEAIAFLTEAKEHLECGSIVAQLAVFHFERKDYSTAAQLWDRYVLLSPLLEKTTAKWLAARRADVAYLLGDYSRAESEARKVDEEFYTTFAETLKESPAFLGRSPSAGDSPSRILLEVEPEKPGTPHDLTNAHVALGTYHKFPAPLPSTTATPAADGLPDTADRQRFEKAGWTVREFTLNITTAHALIAHGLPFFVTLVEGSYSRHHLVVGADRARASIFLMESPDLRPGEAPIAVLRKRYAPFGPRCLALVPPRSSANLEGIDFPDCAAYDQFHKFHTLVLAGDFASAKKQLAELRLQSPSDRLTKFAGLAWARATGHPTLLEKAYADLLRDFPDDPSFLLAHTSVLRDLGRVGERNRILEVQGGKLNSDPLLMQSLAQILLPLPDRNEEAGRLLRRSLQLRSHAAAGWYLLAVQAGEAQDFDRATDLYRVATCLDDREETFSEAYVRSARVAGRQSEALRHFQRRAARTAVPFAPAVQTLVNALLDRDETEQASLALDSAIDKLREAARNPETPSETATKDGLSIAAGSGWSESFRPQRADEPSPAAVALADLLLFRAESAASEGASERALRDLEEARPAAPVGIMLRTAARVARLRPDYRLALSRLDELLEIEPNASDVRRLATGLLAETEGRAAAKSRLEAAAKSRPDSYPIAKLRAEFLHAESDPDAEESARTLLALDPEDAGALRHLAHVLADVKKPEEALAIIQRAGELEPDHPQQWSILAHIYKRADRIDEALTTLREGVKRFPDSELVHDLVSTSRGLREKKTTLRFIAETLHTSPHTGEGLTAYFQQSAATFEQFGESIDPEEFSQFQEELERFLDERPDLWQAWSIVIQGLLTAHRAEEATELAKEAAARFPTVAKILVDLAEALSETGTPEERIDALKEAVSAAPGWVPAARELAELYSESGEDDRAIATLESLVTRNPMDPLAHWALAERLWHTGKSREALDRAKLAVKHDPGVDPRAEIAWSATLSWAERLEVDDEALELARSLTRDRAGDSRTWVRLARRLYEPSQLEESLAALEKAITLDPKNVDAHDLKAERLAMAGRFDEGLAAARPSCFDSELPISLQGRAAWIEARRGNFAAAVPPMQALVAINPDYVWGWQQLAEWYNETGRHENYLEAASELTRLRPDSAVYLTMRGEAKILTGDRAGGKNDLREVVRVQPTYSPAAITLFDAQLADGEERDARATLAVLQEHVAGPESLVKQLQLLVKLKDEAAARRTFADICQTPGEGPPVIMQAAVSEMQSAGWDSIVAEELRTAWESAEEFSPWVVFFWLETDAGEEASHEERLRACQRVVKAYPTFLYAYDSLAAQLAYAERYEEALAACEPTEAIEVPFVLRGRAAWVEAQRGDELRAISLMKKVVEEEPDFGWAWRQLMIWNESQGRHEESIEAADTLVRLSPGDPIAYYVRGNAKRGSGDRRGALEDFRKAFELAPSYEPAGLHLIAEQLAVDDVAGATRSLATLREQADGPLVRLRAVQVAARQEQPNEARHSFRELLQLPGVNRALLNDAAAALCERGYAREITEELAKVIESPEVPTAVAGLWVERMAMEKRDSEVERLLPDIVRRSREAGREAVLAHAGTRTTAQATAEVFKRYSALLQEDDETWTRAAAILHASEDFQGVVDWSSDWRARTQLRPWMLLPLHHALRDLELDDAAEEVARHAVKLSGTAEPPGEFRAWLALSEAVAGQTDEATRFLNGLNQLGLDEGTKLIVAMTEALISVQKAPEGTRSQAFADAKEYLRGIFEGLDADDYPPGAARWYRLVADRLASDSKTIGGRAWAWWQRVRPMLRPKG